MAGDRLSVDLAGVPETLLWTLYQRAVEARRPDAVLRDPRAVELVDAIDYPFREAFGDGRALAQAQALRSLRFDLEVARFLREHPGGSVVELAEGLETRFWRVDDRRAQWLGVDLPEAVAVRRGLLPDGPRQRTFAASALDPTWIGEVDRARGVVVTAQGLLMYLEPAAVDGLLRLIGDRLPGSTLVFDGVSPFFSRRTLRGEATFADGRPLPPMPWALDGAAFAGLRTVHPRVQEVRELRLPRGRGAAYGAVLPALSRIRPLRRLGLSIVRLRFGPAP